MQSSTVSMGYNMGNQLLIAALKAQLIVARGRLRGMEHLDHSDTAIRNAYHIEYEVIDALELEIKELESEV